MRVYDGNIYRDATSEEIAENKAFEEIFCLTSTDEDTSYIDKKIAELQALVLEH